MEAHRHYPPLITELTHSVPANARKKTTPEMKQYEHFMSILDDYKTLSPKQVEKKMRTLDELSDDEEIVLPKYPHDDDDDDDDDDVNVTPQQVMTTAFETPRVSKQLQYFLRKTDERRPPNVYTLATYDKKKKKKNRGKLDPENQIYISVCKKGGSLYLKDCLATKLEGQDF